MGQFPALALAVHRGDIRSGDAVAARRMAVDDLFRGVDPLSQPLPGGGYGPPFPAASLDTPPEAFAIGRITQKATDGPSQGVRVDWDAYWNRTNGVVTSTTGELSWDTRRRIVTVTAPRTQGVIGFAPGTTHALGDVTVDVSPSTPFLSLIVTSLDDLPLASSGHMLVSALGRDRQTGAAYNEAGDRLLDVGAPPLLLEPVQAVLRFGGPAITSVRPLDSHGVPRDAEIGHDANAVTVDGRARTWLFEVRREVGATPSPTGVASPSATPSPNATASTTPESATLTPGPATEHVYLPRVLREGASTSRSQVRTVHVRYRSSHAPTTRTESPYATY
jgi:hypothetical protein